MAMIFFAGCDKHKTILEVIDDDNLSMENQANTSFDSSDAVDCDNLEKTSGGLVSQDACFRDNAIKTKDYIFCGKVENPFNKYACYVGLANDLQDISLCSYIDDEIIRLTCEEQFTE